MNPPVEAGRSSLFAFRIAFIAAIGGFLFGFDLGNDRGSECLSAGTVPPE